MYRLKNLHLMITFHWKKKRTFKSCYLLKKFNSFNTSFNQGPFFLLLQILDWNCTFLFVIIHFADANYWKNSHILHHYHQLDSFHLIAAFLLNKFQFHQKLHLFCQILSINVHFYPKLIFLQDWNKLKKKAFNWSKSVENIPIPMFVVEIDSCAFQGCKSINEINISSTITSIKTSMHDAHHYQK